MLIKDALSDCRSFAKLSCEEQSPEYLEDIVEEIEVEDCSLIVQLEIV